MGTYLLPFTQTLNNHTIAAFSAFFALYLFLRIWDEGMLSGWRFAAVGFFAAFTAVNEIPALSFPRWSRPSCCSGFPGKRCCGWFPALVPIAASVATQYAALGEFKLVYTEFGTESYLWEGASGRRRWSSMPSTFPGSMPRRPRGVASPASPMASISST